MTSKLTSKSMLSYGILALPLSFAGIPLYIYAPDFYATEYNLSLTLLGIILLFLRLIDAVQDPIIGYLSDKYSQHRPTIIYASTALLVISFTLLFYPVLELHLLWFSLFILLASMAFSILGINLNTLGGLWSKNKDEKTTIASYREAFSLIGLVLAVTLPTVLQEEMSKQQSFLYVSGLLFLLMGFSLVIFSRWQSKHLFINTQNRSISFSFSALKSISPPTRRFFGMYLASMVASSIPSVLVLFFIRERLNLEDSTGIFLLCYFLMGAASVIIWNAISKHIGKYRSWMISMLIATASFIWAYFLGEGDFWPYLIICAISGIAFGAELVLPASILADHIQDDKNEQSAAIHYGMLAFLAKLALALAAVITLPYLQFSGFSAGEENSDDALHALSISYAIIPCIIKTISIYLIWRIIHEKNRNPHDRSINHA